MATKGFKCKTQATGGWAAPPCHFRVLFDTVELRFGTRHDHILAHWSKSLLNFHPRDPPGTHRGGLDGGGGSDVHNATQPSPAQPQGPGSHLDTLNGAFKIGPKDGHKGLQVQDPGNRGLGGAAGALKSSV